MTQPLFDLLLGLHYFLALGAVFVDPNQSNNNKSKNPNPSLNSNPNHKDATMHRLPRQSLTAGTTLSPRTCYNCIESSRFHSRRPSRPSKSDRQQGRVDRTRRNGRHNDQRSRGGRGGGGPPPTRMMYYVMPDPPPPPKFDLKTLGMGWTLPSQPVSEHPLVEEVLTTGSISKIRPSVLKNTDTRTSPMPIENMQVNGSSLADVDGMSVSSISTLFDQIQASSELENRDEDEQEEHKEETVANIDSSKTVQRVQSTPDSARTEGAGFIKNDRQPSSLGLSNENELNCDESSGSATPWWAAIKPVQQSAQANSTETAPMDQPKTH